MNRSHTRKATHPAAGTHYHPRFSSRSLGRLLYHHDCPSRSCVWDITSVIGRAAAKNTRLNFRLIRDFFQFPACCIVRVFKCAAADLLRRTLFHGPPRCRPRSHKTRCSGTLFCRRFAGQQGVINGTSLSPNLQRQNRDGKSGNASYAWRPGRQADCRAAQPVIWPKILRESSRCVSAADGNKNSLPCLGNKWSDACSISEVQFSIAPAVSVIYLPLILR